jgi:ERAP1-like C-terminal domain
LKICSNTYNEIIPKTFVHHTVQPIFEKLGVRIVANEPYFDRLARNIAMKWACYVGSEECIKATNDRVKEFISTGQLFEADSRSTIMCNGLRQTNEEEFLIVWGKQQASIVAADRNLMITALGCAQNADLLKTLLGTTIATTGVNYIGTERGAVLTAVINGGIVGVETLIGFLDENHAAASAQYGLATSINSMAAWISTPEHQSLVSSLSCLTKFLNFNNIFSKFSVQCIGRQIGHGHTHNIRLGYECKERRSK